MSMFETFSTSVFVSSSSATSSGVSSGFSGSTVVFPVTVTLLFISFASFSYISASFVTVYVALITLFSPAGKVSICRSSSFSSIPSNSSFTTTFSRSLLPLFVTVIVYVITSPGCTAVVAGNVCVTSFPSSSNITLVMSTTSLSTVIPAVSVVSVFVSVPPTSAVF